MAYSRSSSFVQQIDSQTFRAFGFHQHLPRRAWEYRIDSAIANASEKRKQACLLGICETLSGYQMSGRIDHIGEVDRQIEIPPDTGLQGFCRAHFDGINKVVTLASIVTTKHQLFFGLGPG